MRKYSEGNNPRARGGVEEAVGYQNSGSLEAYSALVKQGTEAKLGYFLYTKTEM